MRLVFMGTPDFAVPSLKRLNQSHHEIACAVTAPDRPKGRGRKLAFSPVKQAAIELNLEVIQTEDLQGDLFYHQLESLRADCFVVVGFRILPPRIFNMPPRGTFNLHASLLPKYRGAAPIQWAVINGEKETGVTTFFIQEKVDTGNIILQSRTPIFPDDTSGNLHNRLAEMGAELVERTADLIALNKAEVFPQSGDACPAPKITPELGRICWTNSAVEIRNLIHGLSPTPGAYTFLGNRRLKILIAEACPELSSKRYAPGMIVESGSDIMRIQTREGMLHVIECQFEGKKRMTATEFLRGYSVTPGDRLNEKPVKTSDSGTG